MFGSPFRTGDHELVPFRSVKTPRSVPMSISREPGSITTDNAGMFGRSLVRLDQVDPPSVVRQTWLLRKPPNVATAVRASRGSTAMSVTAADGSPVADVHVAPRSCVYATRASEEPT